MLSQMQSRGRRSLVLPAPSGFFDHLRYFFGCDSITAGLAERMIVVALICLAMLSS